MKLTLIASLFLVIQGKDDCANECLSFDADGKSVIVRDSTGRLGNQMFVVHMLAGLSLKFGYKAFIGRRSGEALDKFFHNVIKYFPIAEDALCQFDDIHSQFLHNVKEQRMGKLKDLFEKSLGRKLDLKRDDHGRWSIPPEIMQEVNVPYDSLIHSSEFDKLDIKEALPDIETSFPWEFYVDRKIFDLAEEDYVNGRAMILYPKNAAFLANETRFISSGMHTNNYQLNLL